MPRVSRIEVKGCFVLGEQGKNLAGLVGKDFQAGLGDLKYGVEAMGEAELDREMIEQPQWRKTDYDTFEWAYDTVSIDRVGIWYEAGGLPAEFCLGSVRDTANLLEARRIESLPSLCKAKSEVPVMRKVAAVIASERLLSAIAVPGGRRRPTPPRARMTWDLDDGSHRAIALALSGIESLNAYLGIPAR